MDPQWTQGGQDTSMPLLRVGKADTCFFLGSLRPREVTNASLPSTKGLGELDLYDKKKGFGAFFDNS